MTRHTTYPSTSRPLPDHRVGWYGHMPPDQRARADAIMAGYGVHTFAKVTLAKAFDLDPVDAFKDLDLALMVVRDYLDDYGKRDGLP